MTGVQTCALPISHLARNEEPYSRGNRAFLDEERSVETDLNVARRRFLAGAVALWNVRAKRLLPNDRDCGVMALSDPSRKEIKSE